MGIDPSWLTVWRAKGMVAESPPYGTASKSHPGRAKLVTDASWASRIPVEDECTTIAVHVRTPNPLNLGGGKGNWPARVKMGKEQRDATTLAMMALDASQIAQFALGCTIDLIRVSPGKVSEEAVAGCCKHVRDVVAMTILGGTIGQRDDDPILRWVYKQFRSGKGVHGVVISMRATTWASD